MTAAELLKFKAKFPMGPGVLALNAPKDAPPEPAPNIVAGVNWNAGNRHPEAKLNKTELEYWEFLRGLQGGLHGDTWSGVQNITLILGHDCRLTMDFAAVDASGLRLIDTKATIKATGEPLIKEDAWIKMRTAARAFSWIRFLIAWKVDGAWRHREVKS